MKPKITAVIFYHKNNKQLLNNDHFPIQSLHLQFRRLIVIIVNVMNQLLLLLL
jgi:hypothetical protein